MGDSARGFFVRTWWVLYCTGLSQELEAHAVENEEEDPLRVPTVSSFWQLGCTSPLSLSLCICIYTYYWGSKYSLLGRGRPKWYQVETLLLWPAWLIIEEDVNTPPNTFPGVQTSMASGSGAAYVKRRSTLWSIPWTTQSQCRRTRKGTTSQALILLRCNVLRMAVPENLGPQTPCKTRRSSKWCARRLQRNQRLWLVLWVKPCPRQSAP